MQGGLTSSGNGTISEVLKAYDLAGRGTGTQTKVFGNGKILSNWEAFLRNKQNKQELFTYVGFPAGKVVLTTWDGKLLFNPIQQQSLPAQ